MVTKSEEPETLKDAIGAEMSDYLVKPVNPRQILSVVTRLLEGDRIRSSASRATSRPASATSRRAAARTSAGASGSSSSPSSPQWEVKLAAGAGAGAAGGAGAAAGEPAAGLREVPAAQLRHLAPRGPRRPAAALGGHRRGVPPAGAAGARQGALHRGGLPAPRPVGDDPRRSSASCSTWRRRTTSRSCPRPRPTRGTPSSAASSPAEIKSRHPRWWSERGRAQHERARARAAHRAAARADGRAGAGALREGVQRAGRRGAAQAAAGAAGRSRGSRRWCSTSSTSSPTAARRTPALFEVARDMQALRDAHAHLVRALAAARGAARGGAAERAGAAHHRPRLDPLPHPGHRVRHARRHRQPALQVRRGHPRAGCRRGHHGGRPRRRTACPDRGPNTKLILATGDRFFVYPTKLREYQARYRGAFLHGGVTPEEVVLPIALLLPRRG